MTDGVARTVISTTGLLPTAPEVSGAGVIVAYTVIRRDSLSSMSSWSCSSTKGSSRVKGMAQLSSAHSSVHRLTLSLFNLSLLGSFWEALRRYPFCWAMSPIKSRNCCPPRLVLGSSGTTSHLRRRKTISTKTGLEGVSDMVVRPFFTFY
ncbi:hypothetical protein VTN31DRAFT_2599 [Thermomyces dupontii]|uniref:uncharacterized protein n=1 Tax=Talaromyces thermophilus TaxID=28565 RepID=UPI0037428293